ncbi:MAG: hypothetical protein CSB13_05225 [Chloroflexi bacterium]|nr:MAG: hypothetical protein CSB13_05225 [Chloroflexota bacterium]
MSFTTPFALLLLLAIPFFIWLARPRIGGWRRWRWREWFSIGLRILILTLLILSLAGIQVMRTADELAVVFLIDASDSINQTQAEQAEAYVREAIETMTPNDQAAVILFGANALVDRPMSGLAELAPITTVPQPLQTDLAKAVRLGLALFPAGSARRLVMLSDGQPTIGDFEEAVTLASASGVQLDFVDLERPLPEAEALLTNVSAPTKISEGETFRIDVTAESTTDMPAKLRVLSGSNIVHEEDVQLRTGINNFAVRLHAAEQEFARYRVQLIPAKDTYYQNNELAAFTEVTGPPRVLLVADEADIDNTGEPAPDESPQLQLALEAVGLEVERTTPSGLPNSLESFSDYASVILVNVNARDLSQRKMETLQSYVRDLGGGLVAVGGPESYGMGGYYKTPLEEMLPVEMQIKDQERFPSVSIVIVIDRSGSMEMQEGGMEKIQLAAEGAVRVVELLNDFDDITVIPVDTQPDNPIGPLPASDKDTAIGLIRQIGAGGGGIYVRTGLEAAAQALVRSSNQVKHIILLADGADSEEKEGVPRLIDMLVEEGVTVSTVAIGQGPDVSWLQQMAKRGNGRFHFTDRAANLPQIFTQETTAIQRNYLVEERFFPDLVSNSPILAGITAVPPLYGYVGTSPKGAAHVILNTHLGDPLLSAWQYGLGRTVAWTSDATGRWANEWVQWEGFPAFWAQTVRWTMAPERSSNVETAVTFDGEQAVLQVDTRDDNGRYLNDITMTANVVAPDGTVHHIVLPQIAPGRYSGEFLPTEDGAYFLRVNGETLDNESVVGQTSGWVLGYSGEYQPAATEQNALTWLAENFEGRNITEDITAVFDHNLPSESLSRPIWFWLILAAVLLLPFDIAVRRLVITKRDGQRAWAATFGRLLPQPAPQTPQTEQVSRLFQAKERASTQRPQTKPIAPQPPDGSIPPTTPTMPEQAPQPVKPASPPPKKEPTTPKPASPSGSLASRLLDKKQQRNQDD